MRIIHTGDLHVRRGPRFAEAKWILRWVADYICREPPDLVTNGGDIYHADSDAEERLVTSDYVQAVGEAARHVVVRGNHDTERDLLILSRLQTRHPIHVVETADVLHFDLGREKLRLACLAWPAYASGVGDGRNFTTEALQAVLRGFGDELQRLPGDDHQSMLLTHCMVDGAITSTGQPLIGTTASITMSDLALARAQAIAMSHIHKPQEFDALGSPAIYAGSPFRNDFGEVEEKSILEILLEGDRVSWRRIPTPCRPMHLFEAQWVNPNCTSWRMEITSKAFPHTHVMPDSEIRLIVSTPADQLGAARRAAIELLDRCVAEGAAFVKYEMVSQATTRARVPEIRTKRTVPDQLEVMWTARGELPPPERRERLLGKLASLPSSRSHHSTCGGVDMSIDAASWRGMSPAYPGEVKIDFTKLPGKIIALCGKNLAGKSTAAEILMPGALYRDCPTRGPLTELATASNSYCEVKIGGAYTIRQSVDATNGNKTSSVLDASGKEQIKSSKVSDYDKWAAENLVPWELVEVSLFTAQGAGGILAMTSGNRKKILLRAIGIDAIEKLAAEARERMRLAKTEAAAAAKRVVDERARAVPLDQAVAHQHAAMARAGQAENEATSATATLAHIEREAHRIARAAEERNRAIAAIEDASQAVAGAELRINALVSRSLELRDILESESAIREAAARCDEIRAELAALAAQPETWREVMERGNREAERVTSCLEALQRAKRAVEAEAQRMTERDRLLALAADLEPADLALASAREREARAQALLSDLHERGAKGASGRIHSLRDGLGWYPRADREDYVEDAGRRAEQTLAEDITVASQLEHLPADLRTAKEAAASSRTHLEAARRRAESARQARDRAEAMAPRLDLAEAVRVADAEFQEACKRRDATKTELRQASDQDEARRRHRSALESERDRLAPMATQLRELEGALATSDELSRQIADANAAAAGARERLAALQSVRLPAVEAVPDIDAARARLQSAEREREQATVALAMGERTASEAKASAERLSELERERDAADEDHADWTRLATDLGPDGLQAVLVDAAGPELSALTNRFLHECVSTRFTVAIETAPQSEDANREPCEIRVLDSEEGVWKLAKRLSGGGLVQVGEALSDALIVFVCRRYGIRNPTIVRDESGAALDDDNTVAYVAMHRLMADEVGASRVISISHNPAAQALADHRLVVEDGQIHEAA